MVLHAVEVAQTVKMGCGRVADVQVIPLEIGLEKHDEAVAHRGLHEIIYEEVGPHTGTGAEESGQAESDGITGSQDFGFDFGLEFAVETDRPERRLFGAELAFLADAVAAVGRGIDDDLGLGPALRISVRRERRSSAPTGSRLHSGAPLKQARGMIASTLGVRRSSRRGIAGIATEQREPPVRAAVQQRTCRYMKLSKASTSWPSSRRRGTSVEPM